MSDTGKTDYAALLKRSLRAIEQLQGKLADLQRAKTEPIAVIGVGCRFPLGADTPEAFWKLLRDGTDAIVEVPKERWDVDAIYHPDPDREGKSYTRWGSFIDDIDRFDAAFFGVSPREAVNMDPQQRLLLEVAWEALENAAIAPSSLAGGNGAVFLGISTHDYGIQRVDALGANSGDAYTASGSAHSIAAGRLSYVLGLHGPNLAVDTACSSSLVALHLAVRALRAGETDVALAGGVNLTLSAAGSVLTSRARMMSFDGHCKAFDASADGYVRGEGCGILVLKRLSDAQRDDDRVIAVIRGSALSQDGRSSGLTAPNGSAQAAAIRAALDDANLKPEEIDYVEAHGTGTSLGDPIEMNALAQAYGSRPRGQRLQVGSVKTNIGHLEAASGIAGVIKAILMLAHGQIPPHLHLREPNPLIDWDRIPIDVPTTLIPWPATPQRPRRAGVSSFGFSGTNAHVILEEAPAGRTPRSLPERAEVLLLSAHTPAALRALAGRLANSLDTETPPLLTDVAATLALGRSHLPERAALVVEGIDPARDALQQMAAGAETRGMARARASGSGAPEIVFMFTGQGAQYVGMARSLYEAEPVFREALDECSRLLGPELHRPMLDVLFADEAALDDTAWTQPALFAVEWSLARLWRSWGIEPTVVMGHSVGEYVAACIAGVFSLENALRLIAARGRLMSSLPRDGAMLAVFATELQVRDALVGLGDSVSVAATNGPQNTVISGQRDAIETVRARLEGAGVESQRLNVSHAFHSAAMDPMLDEFEALVAQIPLAKPAIGLVSNLSGELADDEILRPLYWRRHAREAVRFAESIAGLQRDKYRLFLEVGPTPVLIGMAKRCSTVPDSVWIASLRKGRDDREAMLEGLAELHVQGASVAWNAVLDADARRRRIVLPGFPFQRERYWHDLGDGLAVSRVAVRTPKSVHPLGITRIESVLPIFSAEIDTQREPWLSDHRIFGHTLFPGAGYLEIATAAAREMLPGSLVVVRDLQLQEALELPDREPVRLQVIAIPAESGRYTLEIHSRETLQEDAAWRLHARCTIEPGGIDESNASAPPAPGPSAVEHAAADYYERLRDHGADYGPAFRGLRSICQEGELLQCEARLTEACSPGAYLLHPALLDACFQLLGVALDGGETLCVPTRVASYCVLRPGASAVRCTARLRQDPDDSALYRADLVMRDLVGELIAIVRGLELRRTTRAAIERSIGGQQDRDWLLETSWVPRAAPVAAERRLDGTWLVLADNMAFALALCSELRNRGAHPHIVQRGPTVARAGDVWTVDAADVSQWRTLFMLMSQEGRQTVAGIVDLRALDVTPLESGATIEQIEDRHRAVLGGLLALVQGLAESTARLCIVTRAAQAIDSETPDLAQAPIWGFAGVVGGEYPAMRCLRIDLGRDVVESDARLIAQSLAADDAEDRVAIRRGEQFVPRLTPGTAEARLREVPLRLEIRERGTLQNLKLERVEREPPARGELELRVHATGLNFRDVLNAMGMYPGDPGPLGNECAGVVTAIGDGVEGFKLGDEVVAMVDRSFATWVLAPAALVVRKPPALSFAEAATVPVAFLTAQYALNELARIHRGDRVLIHAVTGGVGMAALQIALRAGAEVFGTAGTPAKRALARRLGAHHVGDSRSLEFAAQVREATHGAGVDIVLNSLAGDFIPESLGLLRSGGRFVEIGKSGIWSAADVARRFPGVEYFPLYLGEIAAVRPAIVRTMLERLFAAMERGELAPLPMRCWPLEDAERAFRFMAQGQHTGKVVITQGPPPHIRSDARYLITGGLGGLGLVAAKWLAASGARHLLLLGRRPPSTEALKVIAELREQQVAVDVLACDVADGAALSAALAPYLGDIAPIRGILHTAGSVDDGLVPELDLARFDRVSAPKVRGTWNLDRLSRAWPLDFFVLYSSGAALLGSPGQGNYAAANSFMDAFAIARRAEGRHALSINWGSWAGAGMAADVADAHRRRWESLGLLMIQPGDGVEMLSKLLRADRHANVAAIPLVRSRLPDGLAPFYSQLKRAAANVGNQATTKPAVSDMREQLLTVDAPERETLVRHLVIEQTAKVLVLGPSAAIDSRRSLLELGLDSLMAMEFRNRIQSATGCKLSVASLLGGMSIDGVVTALCAQLPPPVHSEGAVREIEWEEGRL